MKLSVDEFLSKLKDEGNLREADLRKSKLKGLQASGADLGKANLSKVNLSKSDLSSTDLSFADLSGANLKEANLSGANLEGANFKKANLEGCDFSGAKVNGANFTGTSLRKATIKNLEIRDIVVSGADMLGVEMDGCTLVNCTSIETNYNGCEVKNLKLIGGNFSKSNFQDSKISDCSATDCDFTETVFSFALIENTSFAGECNFTQAELYSAEFKNTLFNEVNLENANFSASEFKNTELNTSRVSKAAFKSVSGLEDEFLNDLKQKGAVISRKLLKKFSLFVWRSTLAKIVLVLILCSAGASIYLFMKNPDNWGYDKLLQQAAVAAEQQNVDLAEKYYDLALEKYKNTYRESHILFLKGNLAQQKGEYSAAEKIYQRVLTDFPDNEETMFNSSMGIMQTYLERKQYDKAISQAQQILKEWEYFHSIQQVYRMYAGIYLEMGQKEKAFGVIGEFLEKYSEDSESVISGKMMLADFHQRVGEPEKALVVFTELSNMELSDEDLNRVQGSIANIYMQRKEYEKASEMLEELQKRNPNDDVYAVEYLKGKIRIAEMKGNQDEAIRLSLELVEDYPKNPNAPWIMNSVANMYWEQGKEAEAKAIMAQLGDRFGENHNVAIQLINNEARMAREKGELDQALQSYEKLLDQFPNSVEADWAQSGIAQILLEKRQYDQVLEILNELLKKDNIKPELHVSVLQAQSAAYQGLGETDKSIEKLREIENKYSDKKFAKWIFGAIASKYLDSGEYDLAEQNYRRSIEKNADNPNIAANGYRGLATLESRKGNKEGALKIYQEIEKEYGEEKEIQQWLPFSLANLLSQMGRQDEAKAIFEGCLADENSSNEMQANALMGLTHIYRQKGEINTAIELMDRIFEKNKGTENFSHLRIDYAYLLLEDGNISKAESAFQEQIQKCQDVKSIQCREAEMGMVSVFERKSDYANALNTLNEVKEKYPSNMGDEWVDIRIARFKKRLGENKEAEVLFKRILDQCESNVQQCKDVYSEYAAMMTESNERAVAIELYETAIKRLEGKVATGDLVNNLANLYWGAGDREKAFQLFNGNRNHKDAMISMNAMLGIARLHKQNGERRKSLQAYDLVIRKSLDRWQIKDATIEKATLLREMGEVQQGIDLLMALKEKFSTNNKLALSILKSIANFYRANRQFDKAIEVYSELLDEYQKLGWETNWIKLDFANLYKDVGDFDNANALYFELEKEEGKSDELTQNVMMGRSGLLDRMGQGEEAIAILDKMTEKWPNWSELGNVAMRKASIINKMGRKKELETFLESILSKYSENEQLSLNATNMLAQVKQALGKDDEAAKYYAELINQNPDSVTGIWASISYSGLELKRKNYDKAEGILLGLLKKKNLLPEQQLNIYNNLTNLAREREHYSKAIEYQQMISEKYKNQREEGKAMEQIAHIYEKMGKNKEVNRIFNEISERFPDDKDLQLIAIRHRAKIYRSQNDLTAALRENQKIADRYPGTRDAVMAKIEMARLYRETMDNDKAISLLTELRQAVEGRTDLQFLIVRELAESENRRGDHGKSAEYYKEAFKLSPDPQSKVHISQMLAQLYIREKQYAEAKEMLAQVLSSEYANTNQRINVKKMMAELQEKTGNQNGAIKTYKQILEDYPDGESIPWVAMALANIYRKKNMNQDAIAIYQMLRKKWASKKQIVAQAYTGETFVLKEMGKYEEAIVLLERIRKEMPNRKEAGQALLMIGQVYNRMGELKKAKKIFNDVLRLYTRDPNLSKQAILELANMAANENDTTTAITLYKQLAQQFKGRGVAANSMMSIARLHLRADNPNEAEAILMKLMEEYKDEELIILNVKKLLADTKQHKWEYEAAVKLYQDIIKDSPRSRHAIDSMRSLAYIYSRTGRLELAEESYVRILDMNRYFDDTHIQTSARMGLADLAARQKKFDEAAMQYREIIKEVPDTESAGWAKAKIGDIYVGQKNDAEAEVIYKEVLKKYKGKKELRFHVLNQLAQLKSRQEDFNSAIGIYMSIVESSRGTLREGQAMMNIAQIYYKEKEFDKADVLLDDIVERFKRDKRLVEQAYNMQKSIKKLNE